MTLLANLCSLGLDTSCYTTSVALVDSGGLVYDGRTPLEVSFGAVGLRQSEAVFQHVRNTPALIEAALHTARQRGLKVAAVGASAWPRRVRGSYMPVFLVGSGFGRAASASLAAPYIEVSHQEGHIAAASWSSDLGIARRGGFLALHLSGGTTELLAVRDRFSVELLGGTDDLSAGQFIDRIGVKLGIPFPAGPGLERLAADGRSGAARLPVAVARAREPGHLAVSFSGPCSAAMRELGAGTRQADLALGVLECIGQSAAALCAEGLRAAGLRELLASGGVASNSIIRRIMQDEVARMVPGSVLHFAAPEHSRDNAVGVALLAWQAHIENGGASC